MSTPARWRSASPNTTSRWATGSRSKAHGSIPPTRSAPARIAASSSSSGAGVAEDPRLREGHDLHAAAGGMGVAGGEHAFQSLQPAVAVDLGVAANDRRARGDRRPERPRGAGRHVVAGRPPVRPVVLDQPGEARSGRVRAERQTEPRRVEVGVGVGQRRQQHAARAVDGRQVRVVGHDAVGTDRRDAAGADEHVDGIATRHAWPRPHPLQQQVAQLRAPCTWRKASSMIMPAL